MICGACGYDGHPTQVLGMGGRGEGDGFLPPMVSVCARCSRPFPEMSDSSPATVQPTTQPVMVVKTSRPSAVIGPVDAIAICRARLEALEVELEEFESKRNEAATLRRMLDAADSVVHTIGKRRQA